MTTENIVIQAELRDESTKSAIRRARKEGVIPGVLYSHGKAVSIKLVANQLPKEHSRATTIKLMLSGSEKTVLMREVQVNPLNDKPIHFDFQEVAPEDKVRVHLPLNFVGLTREQEKEGAFNIRARYLEVRAPLNKLPRSLDVDVSHLKANESVFLRDVTLAPEIYVRTGKGKNVALASLVKI